MNAVHRAIKEFLAAIPVGTRLALIGGVAVSVRTVPRFTKDADFAVAVTSDEQAEQLVYALRGAGYAPHTTVEQSRADRMSTVRLSQGRREMLVDLLFASSGIEPEVVDEAEPLLTFPKLVAPIARTGHLIALKLLSRNDRDRPRDLADLRALSEVADDVEWERARTAVGLIEARGYARGRDLGAALADLRRETLESRP